MNGINDATLTRSLYALTKQMNVIEIKNESTNNQFNKINAKLTEIENQVKNELGSTNTYNVEIPSNHGFLLNSYDDVSVSVDVKFLILYSEAPDWSVFFEATVFKEGDDTVITHRIIRDDEAHPDIKFTDVKVDGKFFLAIYPNSECSGTFTIISYLPVIGTVVECQDWNSSTLGVDLGKTGIKSASYDTLIVPEIRFNDTNGEYLGRIGIYENNKIACSIRSSDLQNFIAKNLKEDNETRLAALEAKVAALEAKVNES